MKPTADDPFFILVLFLVYILELFQIFKVVRKIFNYRLNENTQCVQCPLMVSKSIDGPN